MKISVLNIIAQMPEIFPIRLTITRDSINTHKQPGSNGPCFVRTDIRMNIRVTIDILVELPELMPITDNRANLWISVAHCP